MITNKRQEGRQAARKFPGKWRDICEEDKAKREIELKPTIRKWELEGSKSQSTVKEISARQDQAGGTRDPSVVGTMIKNGRLFLFWAIALIVASIGALYYAFQPFQVGWILFFMVLGFSGIVIAGMHVALKSYYESRYLTFGLAALSVALAIFGHVYFSLIRGEIFKSLYANSNAFYSTGVNLLKTALTLVSVAVEIGAGFLLFLALENLWSIDVQDFKHLEKARKKMLEASVKIEHLKNLPEVEQKEFYLGGLEGEEMLKKKQQENGNKERRLAWVIPVVILLIILLAMFTGKAFADSENITVVPIDLSRSSVIHDHGGRSEFQKNLAGVERVVKAIEPDSRFIVLGITDDSFSNPLIILDSEIPREPGFFKEKIKAARENLLKEWQEKSKKLQPGFNKSDVFGAIILAAHLMESGKGRLIIFSDLRHYAEGFDLESPSRLDSDGLLVEVEKQGLIPSLEGTEVHCLGVHSRNKSPAYWSSLKKFWEKYFAKARGKLKTYSIIRRLK